MQWTKTLSIYFFLSSPDSSDHMNGRGDANFTGFNMVEIPKEKEMVYWQSAEKDFDQTACQHIVQTVRVGKIASRI